MCTCFHPLYGQADLEGLRSLVVLDMSQNNIDNISERSVHSVYMCSVQGAQNDFLNNVFFKISIHMVHYILFSGHFGTKRTCRYPPVNSHPLDALKPLLYRRWTWRATGCQAYTGAHLMGASGAPWGTFTLHTIFSPKFPGFVIWKTKEWKGIVCYKSIL